MNKNILRKFDLVIYPIPVYVAVDCSDEFLSKKFKEEFKEMDPKLGAAVYTLDDCILIRFRHSDCMDIRFISHEATHAALYVFDYIGCEVDIDNQEPLAYLIDCISNFCDIVKKSIKDEN